MRPYLNTFSKNITKNIFKRLTINSRKPHFSKMIKFKTKKNEFANLWFFKKAWGHTQESIKEIVKDISRNLEKNCINRNQTFYKNSLAKNLHHILTIIELIQKSRTLSIQGSVDIHMSNNFSSF